MQLNCFLFFLVLWIGGILFLLRVLLLWILRLHFPHLMEVALVQPVLEFFQVLHGRNHASGAAGAAAGSVGVAGAASVEVAAVATEVFVLEADSSIRFFQSSKF